MRVNSVFDTMDCAHFKRHYKNCFVFKIAYKILQCETGVIRKLRRRPNEFEMLTLTKRVV